ncbi:MAG TPA: hypothetical protein VK886_01590 [Vicinamibacterales bacterium]|nr:hypothetical protein [Vicinamibacterales bacterium]
MARGAGTSAAMMLAAIAIGSCGSPTRAPGNQAESRWPSEPAGFVALTDQSWTAVAAEHWSRRSGPHDRIVSDPAAPRSPESVLEYLYPAGFAGGVAPATHFFSLDNRKEVFIGLEWRTSDPWQAHASGINKIQFLYLAGSSDIAMVMFGTGGDAYELRVLPQWREHRDSWLTPNATARPVTPGRWHRIEWYLKYESAYRAGDGIVRWWLDGVLVGDYTNIRYPNDGGFVEYQMSPTWGGVGDTKRQADFYRFDHTYISIPGGGA